MKMLVRVVVLGGLLLGGCSITQFHPPTLNSNAVAGPGAPLTQPSPIAKSDECHSTNRKWAAMSITAGVGGVVALGTGIGAASVGATGNPMDPSTGTTVIALSSAAPIFGALAAVTGGLAGYFAQKFVGRCTVVAGAEVPTRPLAMIPTIVIAREPPPESKPQ